MRQHLIVLGTCMIACQGSPGGPSGGGGGAGAAAGDPRSGGGAGDAARPGDARAGDPAGPGGDATTGDATTGGDERAGDTTQLACAQSLAVANERLWPAPGEVFYAQLPVGGLGMGEAAMIVGPGGEVALVDVGNDVHADDIRAFLGEVVTHINATAGFPPRAPDTVDYILITHMHADHGDGIEDLLANVTLTPGGRVIHRGFFDVTPAANPTTVAKLCRTLAARPGTELALCNGPVAAPCDASTWTGTYPATDCAGLDAGDLLDVGAAGPAHLPLGAARIDIPGINGTMGGESYATVVGPLMTGDSNGENARSLVGVLRHGPFRLLFAGDLTGGGSTTDAVEGFYAARLGAATDIGARGVDVLHAGHHGRNTSSSPVWIDRLLPDDGNSRNVVMGISPLHAMSPHQVVLDTLFAGGRLAAGYGWTTNVAVLGATDAALRNAGGGAILVATLAGGERYIVQALDANGAPLWTAGYYAVARCP